MRPTKACLTNLEPEPFRLSSIQALIPTAMVVGCANSYSVLWFSTYVGPISRDRVTSRPRPQSHGNVMPLVLRIEETSSKFHDTKSQRVSSQRVWSSITVQLHPCLLVRQVDQFDELDSFFHQQIGPLPACPARAKAFPAIHSDPTRNANGRPVMKNRSANRRV